MKHCRKIMFILIIAICLALAGSSLLLGQEQASQESQPATADFIVWRAVIGTGIDNREPSGVAETFPASTEKAYCFLEANNIAQDTEVSFVWLHNQKEMLKTILPLNAGQRWRTYAHKNLCGLTGDWKVEIRDAQGNVVKELFFKVE